MWAARTILGRHPNVAIGRDTDARRTHRMNSVFVTVELFEDAVRGSRSAMREDHSCPRREKSENPSRTEGSCFSRRGPKPPGTTSRVPLRPGVRFCGGLKEE